MGPYTAPCDPLRPPPVGIIPVVILTRGTRWNSSFIARKAVVKTVCQDGGVLDILTPDLNFCLAFVATSIFFKAVWTCHYLRSETLSTHPRSAAASSSSQRTSTLQQRYQSVNINPTVYCYQSSTTSRSSPPQSFSTLLGANHIYTSRTSKGSQNRYQTLCRSRDLSS